jgi:hypothetical protein
MAVPLEAQELRPAMEQRAPQEGQEPQPEETGPAQQLTRVLVVPVAVAALRARVLVATVALVDRAS